MEAVQCYCAVCKEADTRQEMGGDKYVRFVKLFEMWKRLEWLYDGSSLGSKVKFVYSDDNRKLYTRVWNESWVETNTTIRKEGNFVPKAVFNSLVKSKFNSKMSKLNELRNEYNELRDLYNSAKYFRSTYDTVSVVNEAGDSQLICACGNDEIFVISPNTHLDHLGVTKDDVESEFEKDQHTSNGIYSSDDYDYSQDEILNKEIKREYEDHKVFNDRVEAHKAEEEFYAVASTMSIGEVCKFLGSRKSELIADIIGEYYSLKMGL